jgi:hypothetical protein
MNALYILSLRVAKKCQIVSQKPKESIKDCQSCLCSCSTQSENIPALGVGGVNGTGGAG